MPSEITLFLLGSGVALFIALLGWSEQIRNPQKETGDLEKKFKDKFNLKSDLTPIVRNTYNTVKKSITTNLLDEVKAITRVLGSKKLKNPKDISLLEKFREANEIVEPLEKFYACKYRWTIYLTTLL
ncbi:MAG: hypothetical protein KAU24_03155, partial [Candidatus Aenigmarchaeota archaeon]|nr:hypothetical protein [Candidatus Aenigmarchaeota archaeon]